MPTLLTDVRDISRIAYGFFASKALFAALNLELFEHLKDGPRDLAALNARTGVPESRLATLLAVLATLGVVGQEDGAFKNSPAAARYLVPGAAAYFGDYYRYQIDRQLYPHMTSLDAGLAGDEAGLAFDSMASLMDDAEEAEAFSRAQHAGSMGPAMLMAKTIDFADVRSLLDVAGGTGAFSIVLAKAHPALRSTVLDFPNVVEVARRYIAEAGLAERISVLGGDALQTDWPADQDAVLMSYLLSAVGEAQIPELLGRAAAAIKPGGRLIVHDFMLDEDRAGPFSAAGFFLYYLALRTDPISFTAGELVPLIEAAGLEVVTHDVMIPEITKYLIARKP